MTPLGFLPPFDIGYFGHSILCGSDIWVAAFWIPKAIRNSLTLSLFTLALKVPLHSHSLVHCLALSLSLCPLTLYAIELSLRLFIFALSRSVFVFALFVHLKGLSAKGWFFYFVYVGKMCKGCSFKWFFMQKDVFCLWNDFRVKFGFLSIFWWKRKSFWSFICSVLGRC